MVISLFLHHFKQEPFHNQFSGCKKFIRSTKKIHTTSFFFIRRFLSSIAMKVHTFHQKKFIGPLVFYLLIFFHQLQRIFQCSYIISTFELTILYHNYSNPFRCRCSIWRETRSLQVAKIVKLRLGKSTRTSVLLFQLWHGMPLSIPCNWSDKKDLYLVYAKKDLTKKFCILFNVSKVVICLLFIQLCI